jgi:hypothetical protein
MAQLGRCRIPSMFLKAASGQPDDADAFFGKFKYVSDLQQGSYSAALDEGILLLENAGKSTLTPIVTYTRAHRSTGLALLHSSFMTTKRRRSFSMLRFPRTSGSAPTQLVNRLLHSVSSRSKVINGNRRQSHRSWQCRDASRVRLPTIIADQADRRG